MPTPLPPTRVKIDDELNRMAPAAKRARLGSVLYDLIASHNALVGKYNALLAKLDSNHAAATDHVTTVGAPAALIVKTPEQR